MTARDFIRAILKSIMGNRLELVLFVRVVGHFLTGEQRESLLVRWKEILGEDGG